MWLLQLSGFRFFSTGQNCLRNLLLLSYYWNANLVCVNRLLISHFSAKKKILIWKPKNRKINRVSDPFLHEPMQSRFIITRCHCIYKLQFGKLLYSDCWSFLHLFIYCETFTFIFLIYIPHFKSDYLCYFSNFSSRSQWFLSFCQVSPLLVNSNVLKSIFRIVMISKLKLSLSNTECKMILLHFKSWNILRRLLGFQQ